MPFDFILDYLLPVEMTVKPFFGMFAIYYREKLLLILRERNNQPGMNGIWIATNGSGASLLRHDIRGTIKKPARVRAGLCEKVMTGSKSRQPTIGKGAFGQWLWYTRLI
jgi:hypothetical protein